MNIEIISLEERAAVHAALAEPARLQIVDLLTVGDHSPSELRVALGLTSNLLAHHLGVLDRAGLTVRARSEGDRRRSYVRLRPAALDKPLPVPVLTTQRVVFVCTGNSARSPLAEAIWAQASTIPATSAGTHPAAAISDKAITAAKRHALPFNPRRPRNLDGVICDSDLVITVCDRAHEHLRPTNALHWSVPNPGHVGTDAAYDATFEEIARRINLLSLQLTNA